MKNIPILLFALTFLVDLYGQSETRYQSGYKIDHYTTEDGIQMPEAIYTMQDDKSHLWFSNLVHLMRYDGHEMKRFPLPGELECTAEHVHYSTRQDLDRYGNFGLKCLGY